MSTIEDSGGKQNEHFILSFVPALCTFLAWYCVGMPPPAGITQEWHSSTGRDRDGIIRSNLSVITRAYNGIKATYIHVHACGNPTALVLGLHCSENGGCRLTPLVGPAWLTLQSSLLCTGEVVASLQSLDQPVVKPSSPPHVSNRPL